MKQNMLKIIQLLLLVSFGFICGIWLVEWWKIFTLVALVVGILITSYLRAKNDYTKIS